jgi:hypothetical protein
MGELAAADILGLDIDLSSCHVKVAELFRYWNSRRPPHGLPGRQHIDPLDVPRLMPHIWLLDIERQPLRFRYRLVGTELVRAGGRELTGHYMDEIHGKFGQSPQAVNYVNLAMTNRPHWRKGSVTFDWDRDHVVVERLILPLCRDGRTADMILGISVFFDLNGRELSA